MKTEKSEALFEQAKKVIPGGVNSPVRAFKAVGGNPLFITKAKGAYMYDEDGNNYVDLINSWGPMITGHANPKIISAVKQACDYSLSFGAPSKREVDIAELITSIIPSVEKVRMVNSGTEATMSAVRLARGYTGRDKIIKFEGCYHGHGDSFLIAAGSGAVTFGSPNSPGVTQGVANDTLTAKYNDLEEVKVLIENNKKQIAAIILEPVAGNMGCVLPKEGFLEGLRSLCDQEGIVLIFDEVMTGFRLALGGAQEVYGVTADLVTYGKIIGGGMPVGAYGGKAEIMDYVSPQGPVYQAGTLSGNPIAMAAGVTMLTDLRDNPSIYNYLEETTALIDNGIRKVLDDLGLKFTSNRLGSMYTLFFNDAKVTNFDEAKACDLELFGKYFRGLLNEGVYLPPSQFETLFVSTEIKEIEINKIVEANRKVLTQMFK